MIVPAHVLAAIRQPAVVYRREGVVEAANDIAEALAGRSLAGMTPAEIAACFNVRYRDGTPILPNDLPAARALGGEEMVDVPLTVATADGRSVHVLATASPLRNSDTITGALSVWQDVTALVDAKTALAAEREAQARQAEGIQVQSQELQTQNEELRVQADELRAVHHERERANCELDRQHRLLDAVLGVLPYSVSLWGRDEQLLWANEVFFANRTVHRDDLVGRSWQALGNDAVVVEPLVREGLRVLDSGAPLSREVEVPGPDGTEWRSVTVLPFGADALLVVTSDITDRKRAEEALRESRQKYQSLIETNVDFVWETDAEGRYTYCSPQMERLWGLSPDEMVGRTPFDVMPADEREKAVAEFMAMARDPQPFMGLESAAYDGRGDLIAIETSGVPFFGDDGVFRGYRGITRDVTERKRTGEAEARLRALMDHNPSLVFVKDEQGGYVYLNETYERRFIHSRDWCGKTDFDFWPRESAELFRANDREVLMSWETHQFLEDSADLDGTRHVWLNYKFPFIDAQGRRFVGGIGIDATARVRAEEALRRSEAEYRHLVEHSPTGIYEIEYAGPRFRSVNDAMCRSLGYTREELMAMNPADLLDEESRERFAERVQTVLAGAPVDRSVAFHVLGRDGREYWAELNVRPTFTEGKVDGALVVAHDITERMRAEEELRETRDYLDSLIDYANAPIIVWDPEFRITRFNAAFENLSGYVADEVIGKDLAVLFPEETREESLEKIKRTITERWQSVEVPILRPDGKVRIALWNSANIYDPSGTTLVATIAQGQDITERKEAEEALRRSEEEYRLLVKHAPSAIYEIANAGPRFRRVNDAMCQVLGYTREELMAMDPGDLLDVEGRARFAERVRRTGAGEPIDSSIAYRLFTKAGREIWAALSVTPTYTDGVPDGALVVAHDITERMRMENALRRSNEELQRFAYVASHDLQEPIRSIVSFSQLLERRYKGRLDADADEFIQFIVDGGNRMQRLIRDLLRVSRVETTAKPPVPTDAGRVAADAVALFNGQIGEIWGSVTVGALPTVMADPAQLEQVFANLVGNAIKYRRPDVRLEVRIEARRTNGLCEFSVSDNGIGIEPEYYDRIFEMFRRLHTHDKYEGTGIGLAVVKRIVDRHGGTVRVESTPGEGSTFFFTLPAA